MNNLLRYTILLTLVFNLSFAETVKLSNDQEKIAEAVIKSHFPGPGITGKLMARISIFGLDPTISFLNKFSYKNGFFAKFSDYNAAISENNWYFLSIEQIERKNRSTAIVIAHDDAERFYFEVTRQTNGTWLVTNSFVLIN